MSEKVGCRFVESGGDGFGPLCLGLGWSTSDELPQAIALPESEQQVAEAMRYAKERGWTAVARATGRSARGGMATRVHPRPRAELVVDLSGMDAVSIDPRRRIAYVEPAVQLRELNRALSAHGLLFPTTDDPTQGIGDYLLEGGLDWSSRTWGQSRKSVRAVEVVTAAGEIKQLGTVAPDRGGTRAFAVPRSSIVTRLVLDLRERPLGMMASVYRYPVSALDDVIEWVESQQPHFAPGLEVSLFVSSSASDGGAEPVMLFADAHCASVPEAVRALAAVDTIPVRATGSAVMRPGTVDGLLDRFDGLPEGSTGQDLSRFVRVARGRRLADVVRLLLESPGSSAARIGLLWWGPTATRPESTTAMHAYLWSANSKGSL